VSEQENRHSLQTTSSAWTTVTADLQLRHSASFIVPLRHPAIEGHFPGNPVVPGVVILQQVISAAENWLGLPLVLRGLPQVKFLRPLPPGEQACLELRSLGARLEFSVSCNGKPVAKGVMSRAMDGTR
jgi:3-hydroxyacyl-[acyl-carrier-protein] dehydratase